MIYPPSDLSEPEEGLVSLLGLLGCQITKKWHSTGENNGKFYWHKSQKLKWKKPG
jgi:hypothetical protein